MVIQAGHASPVNVACFSPDGKLIATGSGTDSWSFVDANVIKLWDVATGTDLRTFRAGQPVGWLAFSPDGRRLAAREEAQSKETNVWDVRSGEPLKDVSVGDDWVILPTSPDKAIAADIEGMDIHLRDVGSGKRLRTLASRTSDFQKVKFSPDCTILASGGTRLSIRLWDLRSGVLRTLVGHTDYPITADFSPNSRLFASAGRDLTVRIWDVASGREIRKLEGHTSREVIGVRFSPDGKTLFSFDRGGFKLWEVDTGRELASAEGSYDLELEYLAFSPQGSILAAHVGDEIVIYDAHTGNVLQRLPVHGWSTFTPDGKRLLVNGYEDVTLWDTSNWKQLSRIDATPKSNKDRPHGHFLRSIVSPDSRTIATAEIVERDYSDIEWRLFIVQAATGTLLHKIVVPADKINDINGGLYFTADSREVMNNGNDRVMMWDVATGELVRSLTEEQEPAAQFRQMFALAPQPYLNQPYSPWSMDGRYVAGIGDNGELNLRDPKTGREICSLVGIDERDWLVVSPEGFFDGSPEGWKRIYWRFNNDTFNHTPLEAFFNEFYHPGLLTDVLAGKAPKLPEEKDLSRVDRRQPKVEIACDGVAASDVAAVVKDRSITLKVMVEENTSAAVQPEHNASSGVRDVRVFRNGTLVKAWRGDVFTLGVGDGCEKVATAAGSPRRVCCTVKLPIVAGCNELTAYAFNDANVKSSDAMFSLTGAAELARKPVLHILSIGLNDYDYRPLQLRFAAADARAFADEIMKRQRALKNFADVKLTLLVDTAATKQAILKAHADLAKAVAPEDSVIVYFAGHGTAQDNHFYLIPHDIGYAEDRPDVDDDGLEELLRRSISDRELEQAFEQIDASQILFVLDACNSGQALEADERRRGPMNSKGLAQLAYEKGMYVLTASQSYQAAHEVSKLGHGLLTYVLVDEALKKSSADRDPADGRVDVCELLNFATDRVPRMQLDEMQLASARGVDLSFSSDDVLVAPEERGEQRPRAFYRNDRQIAPLVLSETSAAPMGGDLEALVAGWDASEENRPALVSRPLNVALSDRTIMDEPIPAKTRDQWTAKLRALQAKDVQSFQLVGSAKKAEWLVQVAAIERPDVVYLAPVFNDETASDDLLRMSPGGDAAVAWLGRELHRIAMLPEDLRTKPQAELAKRAFLGVFRKGPAEDLKADIVEEVNSYYHTPNSSQAVIGTYGKAIRGKRMLGKLPRFEQRGVMQNLDHIRRLETVHREGRGSGKDFLSLFGSRQAWRVVDLGAKISGGREHEVSFEIVGERLEQSDVISALNADSDALNYFDYLRQQGEEPCVVLENVWLTSYAAAQKTNVGLDVNAETVLSTDSAKAQIQNERTSSTELSSPVVRCYQMYEAKLNQGRVVELVSVDP